MNENIDLTKILKDCPKVTKFYSTLYGEVTVNVCNSDTEYPIVLFRYISSKNDAVPICTLTKNGKYNAQFDGECTLFPSRDQRDWSKFSAPWYKKEESIKPKFKVRDKIRHKETNKDYVYEISKVYNNSYGLIGFNWGICIKDQDQYELVPNKFEPKTLKPFDRVLCKNGLDIWRCDFFSSYMETYVCQNVCISGSYSYCIPYNDDTKHLVGTKDEAPDFYRYWED